MTDDISGRSPDDLRSEVLEALGEALDVDLCAWFMVDDAASSHAGLTYGQCLTWSTDADADSLHRLVGREIPCGAFPVAGEKPWLRHQMDLRRSPKKVRNRFRSFAQEVIDMPQIRRTPLWEVFYAPSDIVDQTRMLAYGPDGAFLGWVGALSREPIDVSRLRALAGSELESKVHRALAEAHELEVAASRRLPQPNSFVCTSDGFLVASGDGVTAWVTAHRSLLASVIAAVSGRGEQRFGVRVGRVAVRGHRVAHAGSGAPLWACHTSEAAPPRLTALSSLSPRQHTVAAFAASGATNAEIADALECSVGTVKTHLSTVYRKLGIESRIELTPFFSDDGTQ